ncbi:sugar phosphate isomerase/epimerase family protein [Seonamhaeicola maritimus]|uniref:AP endonuclease n=1 Tax=Seonamhaeicola maritimus TaxID=2591822 RepID=A0A5C7GIB7_9FLAO|nr:TIM barrel protein [Seonamhaeicola maritimus]TXG37282.1 AP endonuclease [Seonamhaeicola maritimus]
MGKYFNFLAALVFLILVFSCKQRANNQLVNQDLYPWCIVAFDSLERSPQERISMLKELGFKKYAYDWRDKHLDNTLTELKLAVKNNIEIISVWLWLNAKRDSIGQLSHGNEKLFDIIEQSGLNTTIWVSMSENYFKDLDQKQSLNRAINFIDFVSNKSKSMGCKVALYNHGGWFGNPYNQIEIIKKLPQHNLNLVYNFHHGHHTIDEFSSLSKAMSPYLSAVNLNGMEKDGEKILPIGKGNYEKSMFQTLKNVGYKGPWGILGHVENADVKVILKQNLKGLKTLEGD